MQRNSTIYNSSFICFKTYNNFNDCMKFYKRINILHCHINPPSFVVNELDAGVVEVPGVDGFEDLLDKGLDDVNT